MSGFFSRIGDLFQQIGETVEAEIGGGIENEVKSGTAGNDRLFGGFGDDVLSPTGAGDDLAVGGTHSDTITGGIGRDVLAGNTGDDVINSTEGGGGITLMFGGDGRDLVIGGVGDNLMFGGAGDDSLIGGGNFIDVVVGGDGNDILNVGTGTGVMIGGAGSDLFAIGPEPAVNGQVDVIVALDFAFGVDRLQVDPAVLSRVTSIQNSALDFDGVIEVLRRHGVFSGDIPGRVSEAGEAPVDQQLATLLAFERASPTGVAVANGALARTTDGDLLFFAGVSAAQLDLLI